MRQEYDGLGRVVNTITRQNGVEINERRQYDAYGNLIAEIDMYGQTRHRKFDGRNKRIATVDANSHTVRL